MRLMTDVDKAESSVISGSICTTKARKRRTGITINESNPNQPSGKPEWFDRGPIAAPRALLIQPRYKKCRECYGGPVELVPQGREGSSRLYRRRVKARGRRVVSPTQVRDAEEWRHPLKQHLYSLDDAFWFLGDTQFTRC
jgi:hypothetical protein